MWCLKDRCSGAVSQQQHDTKVTLALVMLVYTCLLNPVHTLTHYIPTVHFDNILSQIYVPQVVLVGW
jgi:hypothetical protein